MILIDGKNIASVIKKEISEEVKKIVESGNRKPHLAIISVGDDPASKVYVNNKIKACTECNFSYTLIKLNKDVTEDEVLDNINSLNNDPLIDGFIVQLPLPKHISEEKVINTIDYKKDIDGFHPINVGRMVIGLPCYIPATPKGIMELFKRYNIDTKGKRCVVLGRSNIVGKPIANLMLQKNFGDSTVVVCHSHSENLESECKNADIIISAIGQPKFLNGSMVKDDVIIIDVGINRIKDDKTKSGSRIVGDVDFENVYKKSQYITPVPGGVGPMTICMLMQNTLSAYKKEFYL